MSAEFDARQQADLFDFVDAAGIETKQIEQEQNTDSYYSGLVKSLSTDQREILAGIVKLYVPSGFECDATYGNGVFYKDMDSPKYCYDIDPQKPEAIEASSEDLPHDDGSLNSIMFDPPFLTYVKNGRGHKEGKLAMTARFGGYWTYGDLQDHYTRSIAEFYRVLEKKGILVVKCQDIIHNHKMHCTHANVIRWAESVGFRHKDLFVLGAKHRMPGPQKGTQRHARVFHSYFLVFERW